MRLFKKDPLKEIFSDYDREDEEGIFETSKLISDNDPEIVKAMEFALNEPIKYIRKNAERYSERGIELDNEDSFDELDADELLFLGMVDELEERGYVFEFDYKCGLEDFLWGMEQIKSFSLIKDVIPTVNLSEDDDIEAWGKAINAVLGDKARLCCIDIESDSYPVAIATADALKKIPIPMVTAM